MAFHNQGESVGPARFRNVSGRLLAFVVISILVHGSIFLFSTGPLLPQTELRFGATIISTILAPAKNTPSAPPPKNTSESQPKKQTPEVPETTPQTTEIPAIPIITTAVETTPKIEPASDPPQRVKPEPFAPESVTASASPANNSSTLTTESLASQREKQRNYLLGEIQHRLSRYLTYPIRARKRGWQGKVMIVFHINEQGQLNNVRLAQSSGYSLLDRSAVSAIAKLKHIALPDTLGPLQTMELLLPVSYQLRES